MNELVYLKNDEAVCTSVEVAEKFRKRHDKLISEIKRKYPDLIRKSVVQNGGAKFFFESTYENRGKQYPMFLMNRDGFALLVMGFTGKEALEWKLKYIEAFNKMETMLKERNTQLWIEQRQQGKLARKSETDIIQKLVEYAKAQGSKHSNMLYMTYSKLANKMAGISDRNLATFKQLNELSFIENIIMNQIRVGMERSMNYKDIYNNCKRQIELFKDIAYLDAV